MTIFVDTGSAGTGATGTLSGVDSAGSFTLTTGTGAHNTGGQVTLTQSNPSGGSPLRVQLYPLDVTTAGLQLDSGMSMTPSSAGFLVNITSAIANSTTYSWAYRIS